MANDRGPTVNTAPLWEAAQKLFVKDVGEATKETAAVERATLEETIADLRKTQEKASKQYSDHSLHFGSSTSNGAGSTITIRLKTILDKLDLLCRLGDAAMTVAPESVSLVWAGFRMISMGVLADKNTCEFLLTAVDQISNVIIVCEIYAQRYLGQHALVDQFVRKRRAVLDQIPELLAVVLRFSYLTKRLFNHSTKVLRSLSGTLGGKSYALKDAIEEAKTRMATLRDTDKINYQEETMRLLRGIAHDSETLARLEKVSQSAFHEFEATAEGVRNIQSEMYKGREEDRKEKAQKKFKENLDWFRNGQIADVQTPIRQYRENVERKCYEGSCQWIFHDDIPHFKSWMENESGFLWLVGRAGFGKSVLVSTIIDHFDRETPREIQNPVNQAPTPLYFFCKRGVETATKACRIMLHLCYQLFIQAEIHENVTTLQEKYNESLREVQKKFPSFAKLDPSQVGIPALQSLFESLAKQQDRPIVLIVDALDECEDWEYSGFVNALVALANSKARIRVLVSSRQLDSELLRDTPYIEINKQRTEHDITRYVAGSVRTARPKWTKKMMVRAIEGIVQNSLGEFKYATTKVESLKEPGLINSFDQFMQDLKPGMNSAYHQIFETLPKGQRHLLVVALRWLICGRDNIPVEYIADEIELNWDEDKDELEEDVSDDESNTLVSSLLEKLDLEEGSQSESLESDHLGIADTLRRIGRDFVKVQDGLVAILHESVRDFIESSNSASRIPSSLCTRCLQVQRDVDLELSEASQKNGHLLMSEHLLQKLNSYKFQKRYILVEGFETKTEHLSCTSETGSKTPQAEVKNNAADDAVWAVKNQRYEITEWPRHLREAECAWSTEERQRESQRWNSLLDAAERFLNPGSNAYKCWLRRTNVKVKERTFKVYDQPLFTAAFYGLLGLMERYLNKKDSEVDCRNELKNTPLMAVCSGRGGFRGLELLVDRGADVNVQNIWGLTPLLSTIGNGTELGQIRFLLDKGADPTTPSNRGWTPLHVAASKQKHSVCEILLGYSSIEVNAKDNIGETPLHKACKWANTPEDLIRLLLEHKANPNFQDGKSQAPLYEACRSGNFAAARTLLKYEADINDDDVAGDTALHAAVYAGSLDCTRLLVENGIDIWKKNQYQRTALATAASRDQWEIFDYLLGEYTRQSPDTGFLLEEEESGWILLHHSAWCHSDDITRKLLQTGNGEAMCRARNESQDTPFHIAAWRGNVAVVKLLLNYNPPLDWAGYNLPHGATPIDQCFQYWQTANSEKEAYEEVIELLAAKGQVPRRIHKFQCAIEKGSTRLCKLFLDLKHEKDEYGWTPVQLGVQCQAQEITSLFPVDDVCDAHITSWSDRPLPSRWSMTDRSDELHVSEDGLEVSVPKLVENALFANSHRLAVRTDHPVPFRQDRFYFEIEVLESASQYPILGLGYCSRFALLDDMPGWESAAAPTWGFHADDGHTFVWSKDGSAGVPYADKWGSGDVVGCGVDLKTGSIYFTKNGKNLGTAFTDVKGRLFPVCGMGSCSIKVRANFGHDPNVPFRYRDWQTTD